MPELADTPDAVAHVTLPILAGIGYLLQRAGLSERALPTVIQLVNLGLFAGVVAGLVRLRRRAATWRMSLLLGLVGRLAGIR